jgi:hypothetical protein
MHCLSYPNHNRGNGKESFIITAGRNGILKIWDIGLSIEKLSFNPFQKRTVCYLI